MWFILIDRLSQEEGLYVYNMHNIVEKQFLRPAACLTLTLLENGVGKMTAKCSRYQRLNVPSEAQRSSR
jgi:hypothetical protein